MTQQAFIDAYRVNLIQMYAWAQDAAKLDRFLKSCRDTLAGTTNSWSHDGDAVNAAWKSIGGKGRPTLKALRALAA